jgi:hypothetical protein
VPFTPFHMGPGILIKALLQGSFSLIVFGWSQIVMDLQPLIAVLTGVGPYHGFTHTYLGATLLGVFSTITGKYLGELVLALVIGKPRPGIAIAWSVAALSAFIGTYSHIVLDSIMHPDMQPLFPFSQSNALLFLVSDASLHRWCVVTGVVGAAVYFGVIRLRARRRGKLSTGVFDRHS